jgi:hypothetical protein
VSDTQDLQNAHSLLTEEEAASLLSVKPRWLQLDRFGPRRIPFVRLSRRTIRYMRRDIEAFVASRRIAADHRS